MATTHEQLAALVEALEDAWDQGASALRIAGGLPTFEDWEPSAFFGGVEATYGDGAVRAGRVCEYGDKVSGWLKIVLGGAGLVIPAGNLALSLPVAPHVALVDGFPVGTGYVVDADGDIKITAAAEVDVLAADRVVLILDGGSFGAATQPVQDDTPFTWAASDSMLVQFEYERAQP